MEATRFPPGASSPDPLLPGVECLEQMQPSAFGISALVFRIETPEPVTQAIGKYRQLLRGGISGTPLWRELELHNPPGVTRRQMAGKCG